MVKLSFLYNIRTINPVTYEIETVFETNSFQTAEWMMRRYEVSSRLPHWVFHRDGRRALAV